MENHYLTGFRETVHASMFSDFLDMAQHLVEQGGFKDAAAVMAGGVLEEHLRKLCVKHGIDVEVEKRNGLEPKSAATMNDDLARQQIYNKTDQKFVTAWQGIRNDSAHAHYESHTSEDVRIMIQGLRHFVFRFPA